MLHKAIIAAVAILSATSVSAQSGNWSREVATLVAKAHSYPRAAQARGDEGTAKVKLVVGGTGKLVGAEVVQSSGSAILDREAVKIIEKVESFPAPPSGADATLVVPLTWKLS
jgi:protein TonB